MRPLACLLLACGLAGADWESAHREFQRAYRADIGALQRKQALLEVAKADVPQAAELLLTVWTRLEKESAKQRKALFKNRLKIRAVRAKLRDPKLKDRGKRRQIKEELAKQNDADSGLNTRLAALEIEQAAIVTGVRTMKAPATVEWMAETGIARAKSAVLRQEFAMRVAESGAAGVQALLVALDGTKASGVAVSLLRALEKKGEAVGPGLSVVLKQLSHKDWAVRVAAAFVVARAAQPEGVAALVRQVQRETGNSRAQREIARALAALTGQNLGAEPAHWALWWRDNEEKVMAGKVLLGQGRRGAVKSDQGRFYGIPQTDDRIIYVFDTSGSMDVSMENPKFVDGGAVAADDDEDSRFDVALRELLRASRQLRDKASYAVVVYSDHALSLLGDELVAATKKNHARMEQELARIGPEGKTNIYEALDLALRIANVHPESKRGPSRADAVYLISDGSPTGADGKIEDPDRTLQAVRSWNAMRRVAIHTIGIGREHNSTFLERLALENGGRYYAVVPKKKN